MKGGKKEKKRKEKKKGRGETRTQQLHTSILLGFRLRDLAEWPPRLAAHSRRAILSYVCWLKLQAPSPTMSGVPPTALFPSEISLEGTGAS